MKKIQCGGFYVDDEAIETREGKPYLKTGGGGAMVVHLTYSYDEETDTESLMADKTPSEVYEAMKTSLVIGVLNDENTGEENIPLGYATIRGLNQAFLPAFVREVSNQGVISKETVTGNIDDNYWYFS